MADSTGTYTVDKHSSSIRKTINAIVAPWNLPSDEEAVSHEAAARDVAARLIAIYDGKSGRGKLDLARLASGFSAGFAKSFCEHIEDKVRKDKSRNVVDNAFLTYFSRLLNLWSLIKVQLNLRGAQYNPIIDQFETAFVEAYRFLHGYKGGALPHPTDEITAAIAKINTVIPALLGQKRFDELLSGVADERRMEIIAKALSGAPEDSLEYAYFKRLLDAEIVRLEAAKKAASESFSSAIGSGSVMERLARAAQLKKGGKMVVDSSSPVAVNLGELPHVSPVVVDSPSTVVEDDSTKAIRYVDRFSKMPLAAKLAAITARLEAFTKGDKDGLSPDVEGMVAVLLAPMKERATKSMIEVRARVEGMHLESLLPSARLETIAKALADKASDEISVAVKQMLTELQATLLAAQQEGGRLFAAFQHTHEPDTLAQRIDAVVAAIAGLGGSVADENQRAFYKELLDKESARCVTLREQAEKLFQAFKATVRPELLDLAQIPETYMKAKADEEAVRGVDPLVAGHYRTLIDAEGRRVVDLVRVAKETVIKYLATLQEHPPIRRLEAIGGEVVKIREIDPMQASLLQRTQEQLTVAIRAADLKFRSIDLMGCYEHDAALCLWKFNADTFRQVFERATKSIDALVFANAEERQHYSCLLQQASETIVPLMTAVAKKFNEANFGGEEGAQPLSRRLELITAALPGVVGDDLPNVHYRALLQRSGERIQSCLTEAAWIVSLPSSSISEEAQLAEVQRKIRALQTPEILIGSMGLLIDRERVLQQAILKKRASSDSVASSVDSGAERIAKSRAEALGTPSVIVSVIPRSNSGVVELGQLPEAVPSEEEERRKKAAAALTKL
jgi:hypothetical protein